MFLDGFSMTCSLPGLLQALVGLRALANCTQQGSSWVPIVVPGSSGARILHTLPAPKAAIQATQLHVHNARGEQEALCFPLMLPQPCAGQPQDLLQAWEPPGFRPRGCCKPPESHRVSLGVFTQVWDGSWPTSGPAAGGQALGRTAKLTHWQLLPQSPPPTCSSPSCIKTTGPTF